MNLRGNCRLRVLLMGAVAAGVFGPQSIQAGPFSVWKKPSAKQPAPTVPPELLSAPPSEVVVIQPVVQTVTPAAATTGNKSEVMRQLELLYEKDGREMPELNTDIRPVPTNPTGTAPNGTAATLGAPAAPALRTQQPAQYQQPQQQNQPAPAQQQYQPAQAPRQSGQQYLPTQQQPPAAQPPQQAETQPEAKKYPVASFFKKLVAGSKDPKPTKPSTDYRPDVAPVPPMMLTQPQTQPQYQVLVGGTPAATVDATLPRLDGQARSPFVVTVQTTPEAQPRSLNDLPPAPESEFLPPLQTNELPALSGAAELPQLNAIPTAAPAVNPSVVAIPAAPAAEASPFSEMSEAAADEKLELNP
ncbi:MAG TPA: hypothetical protein VGM98_10585, partial [Schlesneria sp.]